MFDYTKLIELNGALSSWIENSSMYFDFQIPDDHYEIFETTGNIFEECDVWLWHTLFHHCLGYEAWQYHHRIHNFDSISSHNYPGLNLGAAAPRQSSHLCKWDLCWKTSRSSSGDMGESRDVMGDHPLATIYIHTSIYQPLCHLNRTNLIWVLNYHKKYFSQNVLFLETVDLNQC